MLPVSLSVAGREVALSDIPVPLELELLLPGKGDWEVELGFGKGRYLQRRARSRPDLRFLGVEMASAYYRLLQKRTRRQEIDNLILIRGEALFLLCSALPRAFAAAVHIYFPDPWPKARHKKRRLFDDESVDLVLGLLKSEGRLYFATDYLEYGSRVREILEAHPAVEVFPRSGVWEDGERTNYESKYEREGRPIMRLEVICNACSAAQMLHPGGRLGVLAATSQPGE